MRKMMWATLVVALAVSPAFGQRQQQRQGQGRGFGGGGSLLLLAQKAVQEDLKLGEDQVKEVTDLSAKQREAFTGLQDLSQEERAQKMQEIAKKNQEAVNKLLKPDQQKRLKQLTLQQGGVMALLNNEEAAKEINLTDDQKEKLTALRRDSAGQFGGGKGKGQGGDRQEAAKKAAEARKANNDKAMEILTADQKAKWKDLTGEPFKGEFQQGFGFGGGFGKGKGKGKDQ